MEPRIIEFPIHRDITGNLYVADQGILPFVPMRVFWMDNLSGERGLHALRTCHQIIIALKGGFTVETSRGQLHNDYWLMDDPNKGLYLPPMTWRRLSVFRNDSICLVLASHPYDPDDYIYEFHEFCNSLATREMEKGLKFADE